MAKIKKTKRESKSPLNINKFTESIFTFERIVSELARLDAQTQSGIVHLAMVDYVKHNEPWTVAEEKKLRKTHGDIIADISLLSTSILWLGLQSFHESLKASQSLINKEDIRGAN